MKFNNTCNCKVDYNILENAICMECERRKILPKEEYKIYMYRGYAGISIKHDKVSVHRIIGKYMLGIDFDSDVSVHHIDGDKLNNDIGNLQIMRNDLHTFIHSPQQYVSEEHKRSFGNRMRNKISRNDVTVEKVEELRKQGMTIPQIAEKLNCGINTVNRRLGMKNY